MTNQEKITIKFLLDNCKTEIDLRWKLKKFVNNGDVSYLGHRQTELNQLIEEGKGKEIKL